MLTIYNSEPKSIGIKDVTDDNKLQFLQQEANNIADILQIRRFTVKLGFPKDKRDEIECTNDSFIVSPDINLDKALTYIACFSRHKWRGENGMFNTDLEYAIDIAQFATGYLYVEFGLEPDLSCDFFNDKGTFVTSILEGFVMEKIRNIMHGNNARKGWIMDVRKKNAKIYG